MHISDGLLELLNKEITTKYTIIRSKNGKPIFEINGYLTNSKYSPLNEAQKFVEANFKENHLHVLIGIGAGYIAEELYSRIDATEQIVIIEPNIKIYESINEINKFSFMNDNNKVVILTGLQFEQIENLMGLLARNFNNRLQLLISPNYEKMYPQFVRQVMMQTKEILMLETMNRNTLKRFHGEWQENFISNLYHAIYSIPFSKLTGQMNVPIVIVSGGPSLQKHIEGIKENRARLFLLCAGSTINTLLSNNIEPDAIVSIDGGFENYKHFQKIKQLKVPILYAPILHKDILKGYQGRKIIFNQRGDLKNIDLIKNIFGYDIGTVSGGPSVANFCLDIAMQITSGPICFIGQDLAYTNNYSHAEGNKRFKVISEEEIINKKMFHTEGYDGNDVLTDYPLFSMKKTFENYMKLCNLSDSNRVYNCTEGGALIEGFINIPFSKFINEYCQINVSNVFDSLLNKCELTKVDELSEKLFKFIEAEKRKSNRVNRLCEEAIKKLEDIRMVPLKWNKALLNDLEKIDEELLELLKNEFLNYLYGEIIFNINNYYLEKNDESESEKQERIYEKSYTLYKGIYSATKISMNWLDDLLEIISQN